MENGLIRVRDIINTTTAISAAKGNLLYAAIEEQLNRGYKYVEVDFSDIKLVISAFLNTAIGQLLSKHSLEEVKSNIVITHLEEATLPLIDLVLENARQYHQDPDKFEAIFIDL